MSSMERACPRTWASRIVVSFINVRIFSPKSCRCPFQRIGSRYIVMHESLELKTNESQTACASLRKMRTRG